MAFLGAPPPAENIKEKSPCLRTGSHLEYGGEGGIDSLRSPLLGPSMGLAPAGPTQALFKNAPGVFVGAARSRARGLSNWLRQLSNPGRGFSSPPAENIKEKSPYLRTGSHLEYGGEGGIDSLRSPLLGPSMGLAPAGPTQALFKNAPGVFVGAARLLRARSVQLAAPVVEPRSGVLIPPAENIKEKSPYLRTGSHLEYGGEGGIDSLRSPLRGSPLTACAVCPTGCASCRTRSGVLIPPCGEYKRKEPVLAYRLSSRIWR